MSPNITYTTLPRSVTGAHAVERARHMLAMHGSVVLLDDLTPQHGATLVVAAHSITTEQMTTLIRHGSGFVEIAIDYDTARRLQIPTMSGIDLDDTRDPATTLPGVGVDAAAGVTTGISATDRAHTARLLAARSTTPTDLHRPGHLLPVLISEHAAHNPRSLTAGAFALTRSATGIPAAVHCELVSPTSDIYMASIHEAIQTARSLLIPAVALSSVLAHVSAASNMIGA